MLIGFEKCFGYLSVIIHSNSVWAHGFACCIFKTPLTCQPAWPRAGYALEVCLCAAAPWATPTFILWQSTSQKVDQLGHVDMGGNLPSCGELKQNCQHKIRKKSSLINPTPNKLMGVRLAYSSDFVFKMTMSWIRSSRTKRSTKGLRSLYAVLAVPYSSRYLTTAATLSECSFFAVEEACELENAMLLSKTSLTLARDAFRLQLLSTPESGPRWASISALTSCLYVVSFVGLTHR